MYQLPGEIPGLRENFWVGVDRGTSTWDINQRWRSGRDVMERLCDANRSTAWLLLPKIDVDETEFGGVSHKVHGVVQAELLHNIGAVVLDGFNTDAEPVRDIRFG